LVSRVALVTDVHSLIHIPIFAGYSSPYASLDQANRDK
jgi:hypothetical protein